MWVVIYRPGQRARLFASLNADTKQARLPVRPDMKDKDVDTQRKVGRGVCDDRCE